MSVFAISDIHLGFSMNKPMEKFGEVWKEHYIKIKKNWEGIVSETDTVIIVGDISWAMYLEDALEDFKFIDSLPGKKYITKGNHDYWWNTKKKIDDFLRDNGINTIQIINNSYVEVEDKIICALRRLGQN